MSTEHTHTLLISQTWDGRPAALPQPYTLTLTLTQEGLHIHVDAPLYHDPLPPQAPGQTPGLWEYEVVELFIAESSPSDPETPRYTELEMGPHGHWLLLQLEGIRSAVAEPTLDTSFDTAQHGAERWTGNFLLPWSLLPQGPYKINAYAIHGRGEERRYYAMSAVPGLQPDFHRLQHFVEAPWLTPPLGP